MLQAWLKILNVEKTMTENVGVYKRMLELAREFSTEVCVIYTKMLLIIHIVSAPKMLNDRTHFMR